MLPAVFSSAVQIIDHLESHGFQAYFVGGCVRDVLLHRPFEDIDIASSAKPAQVQELFQKVIPVGLQHGTVIVRIHGKSYEVTTFRAESEYTDKRHPDRVNFIKKIDLDLARRDFTMNALAMDKTGRILDLFGGRGDLQVKKIKTVGDAQQRFSEDALRMVRAVRFSSQLGFSIDSDTMHAIHICQDSIGQVAVERLANEMNKFFAGKFINHGLVSLKASKICRHLPIFKQHPNLLDKLTMDLVPLQSFGQVIALFHYLEPNISISEWVKAWKCSNLVKGQAEKLYSSLSYYRQYGLDNWFVYQTDQTLHNKLFALLKLLFGEEMFDTNTFMQVYQTLEINSRKELKINGAELIALFPALPAGSWIEKLLKKIETAVVGRKLNNDNASLREWVKCNPPEIN